MKPGKYAVHFESRTFGKTYIHVFANSAMDACQYVVDHGIGFHKLTNVFPDTITGVEELISPVERVLTNEDAFLTLEDAVDYLEAVENKDQAAIDILVACHLYIGPMGQIPSWVRDTATV